MKKKYYYTYKITCTEGSFKDKIYFGKYSTNNLDKEYKGSGKLLKDYYKKYPNGYIKEILAFYNSLDELNKAEYELIHPHLGKDYCLNIIEGGGGCSLSGEQNGFFGKHHSDEQREKWSKERKGKPNPQGPHKSRRGISTWNKGKHYKLSPCTDEHKQKISESKSNTHRVYDNPERTKWHMEKNIN